MLLFWIFIVWKIVVKKYRVILNDFVFIYCFVFVNVGKLKGFNGFIVIVREFFIFLVVKFEDFMYFSLWIIGFLRLWFNLVSVYFISLVCDFYFLRFGSSFVIF